MAARMAERHVDRVLVGSKPGESGEARCEEGGETPCPAGAPNQKRRAFVAAVPVRADGKALERFLLGMLLQVAKPLTGRRLGSCVSSRLHL